MQKIFSLFFFVGNIGNCSIFGMSRRPTDLTNIYESAQHEYSFQLFKSRFLHERLLSCMHVWPAISCKAMGEDEHFTNIRPFWQICHSGIFPSHIVTKDIVMDDRLMVLRVYHQELAFFISPTFVSSQKIFEKTLWFDGEIYQEIYQVKVLRISQKCWYTSGAGCKRKL